MRDSPEAVEARMRSRTQFEGLGSQQATRVAAETFASVVNEPVGGMPRLEPGQQLAGFQAANVARLDLRGGAHGLIVSGTPLAVRTSSHAWTPIDLRLQRSGDAFAPVRPLVAVRIPRRAAEGAEIPSSGISITPVDEKGVPLQGAEGVDEEAGVLFANTQLDSDTVLKPSDLGVQADTILRGVASPERLYFRVGLPHGARMIQPRSAGGRVLVVTGTRTTGVIPAPTAIDAAGSAVPVRMSVSGNVLNVTVSHRTGSFRYPIAVDPEYVEVYETGEAGYGNWHFYQAGGYTTETGRGLVMTHTGAFGIGDYGFWKMQTKGYTKIYAVAANMGFSPTYTYGHGEEFIYPYMQSWLEIAGPVEREKLPTGNPPNPPLTKDVELCATPSCTQFGVEESNSAAFEVTTLESGSATFSGGFEPTVYIAQEKGLHSRALSNTTAPELEYIAEGKATKQPNVLYASGQWFGPNHGALEVQTFDNGLGVSELAVETGNWPGWGSELWQLFGRKEYLASTSCIGIQCSEAEHETFSYNSLGGNGATKLPNGEYQIRSVAHSAMPGSSSAEYGGEPHEIKVDATPPHGITLTPLAGIRTVTKKKEAFGKIVEYQVLQLGENEAHIKVEATDGEGSTPSSGVQSLALGVDGKEIGSPGGSCSRGPCTAEHEWAINGAELGVGQYTLTVVATDKADNIATSTYTLEVFHASPVAMGPGSVNPESGDFAMEATDVEVSGGLGALAVSRHYDSRNLTEGGSGPLGPQWSIGLGRLAELEVLPDGSVMVVGPEGLTHFATKEGGGFEAPEGDKNLTLEYEPKKPAYLVKDPKQGTATEFTLPKGGQKWLPTVSEGPVATDKLTDEYKSVELGEGKVSVEPTLEVAAHPSATCAHAQLEKLEIAAKGCRALEFAYDEGESTAKGEARSQWGTYKHHLEEVNFIAYNPATKAMAKTPVAEYEYDSKGRLRAEWNPSITPALKTTYGYDAEGHVTAVVPPGQQPWIMTYGTTPGDADTGRLLKVMRPPASTSLWGGTLPTDTEVPKLSGTPQVGVTMGVSNGTWTNATTYAYQWEDCATSTECVPINGATNPNYTPAITDAGYMLVAVVTATNAGGSVTTATADSARVNAEKGGEGTHYAPQPGTTIEYGVPLSGTGLPNMTSGEVAKWGEQDDPYAATAIVPASEPQSWPTTKYTRASIYYMDSQARTVNLATPAGGISTTEYNENNEVTRTLTANNRAVALKEANPATASELLDTKSSYNSEGLLAGTLGPQHAVRLATGEKGPNEEVLARNHMSYFYNEGAKPVEEAKDESYDLVTKTIDGAETASKAEYDKRTTITSYSGQGDRGWTLRKPTSTTTNPEGLALTHTTEYNEAGDVIETKAPEGTADVVYPPVFNKDFGSAGSGNDEFNHPEGLLGYAGKVIAVDQGNDRFEEFKADGSAGFVSAYGSAGTGDLEFSAPFGIAVDPVTGQLYISDSGNNRIEVVTVAGKFVEAIGWGVKDGKEELETCETACKAGLPGAGNGEFDDPTGLTFSSGGYLWVTDTKNNRVEEISPEDKYMSQFGTKGSGNGQLSEPTGIASDEGEFYVVDYGNDRVEEFSPSGTYLSQFGSKGSGERQFNYPVSIVANATSGDLYISDTGNSRLQEWTPAGKFLTEIGRYGTEAGELSYPTGMALEHNKLYAADQDNNRISQWNAQPEGGARMNYANQFGSAGSGNGEFSYPIGDAIDGHGNVWVSDYDNNRIEEFSAAGKFLNAYGTHGSGHVQFSGPSGIAVNQSTGDVYVGDCGNHRIEELNEKGEYVTAFGTAGSEPGEMGCPHGVKVDASGHVWVVDTEHDRVEEYSSSGTFIATYGKAGSEEGEFDDPTDLTVSGGNVYVTDTGNHRVDEFEPTTGETLHEFGKEGGGDGEFYEPTEIAADPAGNVYVVDSSDGRVQEFGASGGFLARFASQGSGEGQLSGPLGIAINAAGSMYVVDSGNNRVEQWLPVIQSVHDSQTIYYTAKEEAEVATCREHPEWVGLPCQTKPLVQPGTTEPPELPVITSTYNMWDQPEEVEEAFGATVRIKKTTFEASGRPRAIEEKLSNRTIEEKLSNDIALPKVTDTYNTTNGALETQSIPVGEATKTITTQYNTLGQMSAYTDADGNTATYEYEPEKENRLTKVTDAKGNQTYTYEETTGELKELHDSAAGTFTAARNVEGAITSETYPDGLTAYYTYNSVGTATSLEYKKMTHCSEKCTWFSDAIVPSIHGETLKQTSTLSEEPSYTYDAAGRLTAAQEIPAGEGCKTRIYSYDEENNRTHEVTREPGTEGKCATEGGKTERHTYDNANRLTDPGTVYEAFGNTTTLPATDADGSPIETSYYIDSQVFKQTQSEETFEYKLDPEGRPRDTVSSGKAAATVISHYDGPGNALAWTNETAESKEKWTRDIPGIGGELTAVEPSVGHTVLELHDLQGDIVATAGLSETETELLSKYNSTEFGVPTTKEKPPTYAWLGADGVASELPAGTITQDGVTYVPQTGRALQTQPVEVPIPADSATPFVSVQSQWVIQSGIEASARQVAIAEEARRAEQGGSSCNIETEGCAPDPEHGKNEFGCNVNASWGVEVEINASFKCALEPSAVELEIEIWRVQNGKYILFYKGLKPFYWKKNGSFEEEVGSCESWSWYRGWVYGRVWAFNVFIWSDAFVLAKNKQCVEHDANLSEPEFEPGGGKDDDE
jgi:YD repeat-containing protein